MRRTRGDILRGAAHDRAALDERGILRRVLEDAAAEISKDARKPAERGTHPRNHSAVSKHCQSCLDPDMPHVAPRILGVANVS